MPAGLTAPRHRLAIYPGRVHLVLFIQRDQVLDVFGERLTFISPDGTPVHDLPYQLSG